MGDKRSLELVFGPFRFFPAERRLEKEGEPVRLGGRALDLLVALVERAGEVVSNRTLLETVWADVTVEQSSLRFHVRNLRKALGDTPSGGPYVTNVPGRGYCFAAPITQKEVDTPRLAAAWGRTRTSLPPREAMVVGRSDNMDAVCRDLLRKRVVTIAGPAGIGKTTLAIAAAGALRGSFGDAVLFVDLAPIEDPSLVVSTVVSALGLGVRADDPAAAVIGLLRNERLLIVLDNCEHVVEAAAALVDRILRETAETHLVVTSREPLRIAGERVHRLAPLECPPVKADITAGEAKAYAAVQLFVDRAAASVEGFSLDDQQAPAVAEICRRLDGIPFAIELAAARVEFFGVSGLASRLDNMFAVLTQGRRLALPRHQTLRATLDWGYDLLSPSEQTVLRRLSIFRTTFSLESALAIVVDPEVSVDDAVAAMADLVAKSLLGADGKSRAPSYRLLEATRLYAGEKLATREEGSSTARRHAEHQAALIEGAAVNRQFDTGREWLQVHAARLDDVRTALDWCFSPGGDLSIGFRLIARSLRLWLSLSLTLEYVERVERALQRLSDLRQPDPATELHLQVSFGYAIWYSASRRDRLESAFNRALQLAEEVGDRQARLHGLWGMWAVRRARSQYRAALATAEDYRAVAMADGDPASVVLGDRILGLTHHYLGDQESARQSLEPVHRAVRQIGTAPAGEFQLGSEVAVPALMARVLWLQGLPDQANAALGEAVDAAQRSEHWFSLYYTLCLAGCPLALWTGDLAQVSTYLDLITDRAADDRWKRCWALILRQRQGGERERLIASFLEPRVDLLTSERIAALAVQPVIALPERDEDVGEALWCLPEIRRVNAELLLWQGGPHALPAAEAQLLGALDVARQQSTLSWELRVATSLARLWRGDGHAGKARDLIASTLDRFTEGFSTSDVMTANRLLAECA